ncbi:uncharacterized protein KRP23_9313 [Phytophthora ramorum]|uniref:uncharacterized protein n=1 Tax=Phytophthora ramorum TaxID=164328 RepID=UPI0030ACC8AA|nr:hypothetical protein KRP23_9313 [Phytophthora ramorum]
MFVCFQQSKGRRERKGLDECVLCASSQCLFEQSQAARTVPPSVRLCAESMSNVVQGDSVSDAQTAAGESGEATATDEERQHEAEEKRWREELDSHRLTMGDAEELCVFLVEDLLAAIFQEMQVRTENATLFATSVQKMCAQAFESVDMSSFQPVDSLDRIPGPAQHELRGRQQVLKPQSKWAPCSQPQTRNADAPVLASSLATQPSPPLVFLRRLLKFLDTHTERTELELLRFPTSEATSSLSDKRKFVGIGTSGGGQGEWCISVDQVSAFLHQLLSKGLVSVVPSTIAFVMAVNRESLEKRTHSQGRITLPHLQQFVQKALLTAEEEEEERADMQRPPSSSPAKDKTESESTPRSRIFQTEVPLSKVAFQDVLKGVKKPFEQPEVGPQQELLSSYLEEMPPRAIEMDRRAPGQVGKKAALSAANPSQRAISRKILMLLAPTPRQGSRWTTVRHKVIVPPAGEAKSDTVMTITAEADMELHLAGARHQSSTLGSSAGRKAIGLRIQTPRTGTIAENEEMPDAAALSNIFSLGTPRQLSAQELARRNDLLAQLEREAAHAQRRASTTIIASMSLGGPPARRESDDDVCPSQADQQQFQAHVAANSIVTTGVESSGRSGSLSPTRPQRGDEPAAPRSRGRVNATRSKFELERDSLPFSVSDGNAHTREEQERLAAAMCSPIKRPRPSIAPSPPPETPGRPIRTPSTLAHLPQLDSSRLAVGVSAVVRGVEKRGPRRNPSRKSRLQLHNYSTAFDGVADGDEAKANNGGRMPFSPVRASNAPALAASASGAAGSEESHDYRLPLIPVMSPIKASPHRKHVAFKFQRDTDKDRVPASISPKAHVRQRPSPKVKQPVWEAKTRSPPRERNHHFATGRNFRKLQRYSEEEEESSSARRQKQEEQAFNMFRQPMAAPRRNVLSTASELGGDS